MEIIYGQADWTTGLVKFGQEDDECATPYDCLDAVLTGCIIFDTEDPNYGKVEVVVSGFPVEACNKTYYGCVDWNTGKFQIELEEVENGCCYEEPEPPEPPIPGWDGAGWYVLVLEQYYADDTTCTGPMYICYASCWYFGTEPAPFTCKFYAPWNIWYKYAWCAGPYPTEEMCVQLIDECETLWGCNV